LAPICPDLEGSAEDDATEIDVGDDRRAGEADFESGRIR
jgi:hypothetical protein